MGLLFLRSIGLVKTKVLRIGYGKNKDIGLVKAIDYKIGFENNRMDGLVQIKDNQTPTNNPQANERHFTNERTHQTNQRTNEKIKRAHADNIKHSTRTQRKNKRGSTA